MDSDSTLYAVECIKKDDEKLYVALYKDGVLKACGTNKQEGTFNVSEDGEYEIGAYIWSDNMEPLCESKEKTLTIADGKTNEFSVLWTSTTDSSRWTDMGKVEAAEWDENTDALSSSYIIVDQDVRYQTLDKNPWGGCFNERGYRAMDNLSDAEKYEIINALFGEDGLNFTAARTALGNSDYSTEHSSYDETAGDYDMEHFSIEKDEKYLLPYIKTALEIKPDLFIFASPWSPPSWMKNNNSINGVDEDNTIIFDEQTLSAYAKYFVKYLQAYKDEGIDIKAVTPQNEPTMNTNYSSCVWTGEQLNEFIRDYLYPAVNEYSEDVKIWHGTFTDSQTSLAMPALNDSVTREMIDAVCFQWWGAPLADTIYKNNRGLKLVQSETKCGDGKNNWTYAEEQFDCFKEFLDAGISQYFLWNMILDEKGYNTAETWAQNAPITVNSSTNEVSYNPSYYLTKHFSYYIDGGAGRIKTSGTYTDAIAFQNPDGENVLEVKNGADVASKVVISFNGKRIDVVLPAHSINTFRADGEVTTTDDSTYSDSGDSGEEIALSLRLTNKNSGMLLSVADASYDNGADVVQNTNKGESYQIWRLTAVEDGYYQFVNNNSAKAMGVYSGSADENAHVVQWDANTSYDQQWKLEKVILDEKTYYKVVNRNSGKCLTVTDGSTDDGAAVVQVDYTGSASQLWGVTVISGTLPE